MDMLADVDDTRSIKGKAAAAGLSTRHAYRLTADVDFGVALVLRRRESVNRHLGGVYRRLVEDAKNDKLPAVDRHRAAKLLLEANGELNAPGVTVNDNRSGMVLSLPERLQSHLADRRRMLGEPEENGVPGLFKSLFARMQQGAPAPGMVEVAVVEEPEVSQSPGEVVE